MLAFDVINLEQHRALQQNAASVYLRHPRGSELPLIARPSSGCKPSKLNRQKLQKRLRAICRPASFSSKRDLDTSATRKMDLPPTKNEAFLQCAHTISTRFWSKSRSYRKQTTKPFLPGATTACSDTACSSIFRISTAALSDESRLRSEAAKPFSQSPNQSETYGRS
jgi:hypothetical protein